MFPSLQVIVKQNPACLSLCVVYFIFEQLDYLTRANVFRLQQQIVAFERGKSTDLYHYKLFEGAKSHLCGGDG